MHRETVDGSIHPFPLPGNPCRISVGPAFNVSAVELRRRNPAMMKLSTGKSGDSILWVMAHDCVADRAAKPTWTPAFGSTTPPKNPSGPGYRDPVENIRGDSVQSPEHPAERTCGPGKATLNLGNLTGLTQIGSGLVWLMKATSAFSFSVSMAVRSGTCPGVKVV